MAGVSDRVCVHGVVVVGVVIVDVIIIGDGDYCSSSDYGCG